MSTYMDLKLNEKEVQKLIDAISSYTSKVNEQLPKEHPSVQAIVSEAMIEYDKLKAYLEAKLRSFKEE